MEFFAKKNGEPTWFKPHKKNGSLSRNMGIGNQQLLVHVEKPLQEYVGKKAPWAVKKADFLYFEDHR